jgi:dTDP-4-amino-4,6-dideoxygalactose transaminase
MLNIPFTKPTRTGHELKYLEDSMSSDSLSGDGAYTKRVESWFEKTLGTRRCLLTSSCTSALEMAAILINLRPGDEVIMPSYTFVSTANAFVLRGAAIVFVDISPATLNIDPNFIESAITSKTKAIVPVHYAGVGCQMSYINELASKYKLDVLIFPKVMSFQNVLALGLPEKGHDQGW